MFSKPHRFSTIYLSPLFQSCVAKLDLASKKGVTEIFQNSNGNKANIVQLIYKSYFYTLYIIYIIDIYPVSQTTLRSGPIAWGSNHRLFPLSYLIVFKHHTTLPFCVLIVSFRCCDFILICFKLFFHSYSLYLYLPWF